MASKKYSKKRTKRGGRGYLLYLSLIIVAAVVAVAIAFGNAGDMLSNGSLVDDIPSSSQPKEPYKVSSATVVNTGDLLMHSPIISGAYNKADGTYDFSGIFPEVSPYFKSADLAVANLEVTFGGPESGAYSGYPCFNLPDSLADNATAAGIDLLLTANNHSYDTGLFGLKRTVQVLKSKQIEYLGTRETADEPTYIVKDVNGINIGMACFTYENTSPAPGRKSINGRVIAEEANPLLSSFSYENLDSFYAEAQNMISGMRDGGADCIVFYMHWGEEYKLSPNNWQKQIAQRLTDLGVDVIVGGHPHVVQPMELLTSSDGSHNTVCIYSMGNAVSNQRKERMDSCRSGHTEDGMLFYYTFDKYSDGKVVLSSVDIIPTWVYLNKVDGQSKYTIYPLESADAATVKYGLSESIAAQATASFKRTEELVAGSLAQCQSHLGCDVRFVNALPAEPVAE